VNPLQYERAPISFFQHAMLGAETFMTHHSIATTGLLIAALVKGGLASFTIAGLIYLAISLVLLYLASTFTRTMTLPERLQMTLFERSLFAVAGALTPIVGLAVRIAYI